MVMPMQPLWEPLVNNGTVEVYNKSFLSINGTLTNNSGGTFLLYGPGDVATLGSLNNSGYIDLENASALTVNGDVNNSGNIYTSDLGGSGHNTITINGNAEQNRGRAGHAVQPDRHADSQRGRGH